MVVAHNMLAMNAARQFGLITGKKQKTTEKLSSGYRINRAADDAAGLAISEKMRRQIRGLTRGSQNIQEGIGLVQTADGALNEVQDMLGRLTELSVKAANDTMTDEDRGFIQEEVDGLLAEIIRIADDTEFNEVKLFDDPDYYTLDEGSITKLVSCKSADYGRLHESYASSDGKYYPAAYVNFSGITASNISKLNGGNFSFCCSQNCKEVFDITFTTDGTPSSAKNLGTGQHHMYSVDISGCTSGAEVASRIYDYVSNHLPSTAGVPALTEGVKVSHSNNLILDGVKLIVARNYSGFASDAAAAKEYEKKTGDSGKITCSEIMAEVMPEQRDFRIQCSSNVDDHLMVSIFRMNTEKLGINALHVTTASVASNAIDKIKNASQIISEHRSKLGSQQNRLEHTYNNNRNIEENTTAAESQIRDADMAKEMVAYSTHNILEQAGMSMIANANQTQQGVLSILNN